MILIVLILFVAVLLLLMSWMRILQNRQGFNLKGPFPLPVLGNGLLFIVKSTEILNLLYKLSQKYGDAYLVYFLSSPYVVLSHPKHIEPIVTSSELITKGRSYDFLFSWLGNGLLTATGQRWKTHRRFLTPAFHFNILQNFLPIFCKNGTILTDKLDDLADGQPVNLFPIVALAALDNVTEAIMGLSVDSQKNSSSEYVKSIDVISSIITKRMQVPILREDWIFNLTADKKKQDIALKFLHNHTKTVIETRRGDLNKMNITSLEDSNELGIKNRHAFLDLLLLAEVDGQRIKEEHIREEVDTFMFEGHDTTTSGIVYSLFCISKYKEVQEKILEEQRSIFGDDFKRDPTYVELNKMKYLEQVIKESLRLYPSVPMIERTMTRDIEFGELKLLKNASVLINIFQMQRNPAVFENPLEFRPERFDPASSEIKNPFSYLAFSAGPRNCIGQKFAMMELKVTVSQIVKHFELLPADLEPELCADLILKSKNGIYVKFHRRSKDWIKNRHAFLDLLLLAEVDGQRIKEEHIREEVDTFMFEGHDTTTSGIVYSLFCISKYKEVQEKILEEQRSIFGDDFKRDPTYVELNKMKYLEQVIKESLRLYPSVPMIERTMTRDIEIGELKLLKNASVLINIFQMQRNPAVFENPLEFRPERFDPASSEIKNPFSYLAFSAGPRNCIGQKFAMMELKVTVSQIVKHFELLPADLEPELCADLILKSKNGIYIKFHRRSKD